MWWGRHRDGERDCEIPSRTVSHSWVQAWTQQLASQCACNEKKQIGQRSWMKRIRLAGRLLADGSPAAAHRGISSVARAE